MSNRFTTRRQFLELSGGAVAVAVVTACTSDGENSPDRSLSTTSRDTSTTTAASTVALTALAAADFDGIGTCQLMPEMTAGPFPLDRQLHRRDITENVDGHPLRLGLRVVDARCNPISDAEVEIWHTDATGDYSAFADGGGGKDAGPGSTFLRGTQTSGADGIVEFLTIYPGWYRGRAVHIHVRARRAGNTVLTSQMFFDDANTETIFRAAPYARFGKPDTTNAQDAIAGDPVAAGTLLVTRDAETTRGQGSLALLNLGVDPS